MESCRLAKALRLYLAAEGIDQDVIANQLSISEAAMSRFVNGKNILDATNIVNLMKWLLECPS